MTTKRPLCNYDGTIKELASDDAVIGAGLFEVDIDGGLMPIMDNLSDAYYELDANDDIMPIAA